MTQAHMPKVSVILPTYNREALLRQAVTSVFEQTFIDWELIIADDGSTDGTRTYLDELRDSRVRSVLLDHSGNPSRVRNAAIALARGEWIAFLDSDDLWLPTKLKLQLDRLAANPASRWSCTGVGFIDEHGAPIPQRAGAPYGAQSGWILEQLLTFTAAATMPTLMVHTSLLDDVAGFDEALVLREDYDLELRLAAHSEIHALPEALTLVRDHQDRTTTRKRVADLHRGTERVLRKAARTATSKTVRAICRRQCATQLVHRARTLSREGEHGAALGSAARAIRDAPLASEVWRAAIGCGLRFLRLRTERA